MQIKWLFELTIQYHTPSSAVRSEVAVYLHVYQYQTSDGLSCPTWLHIVLGLPLSLTPSTLYTRPSYCISPRTASECQTSPFSFLAPHSIDTQSTVLHVHVPCLASVHHCTPDADHASWCIFFLCDAPAADAL